LGGVVAACNSSKSRAIKLNIRTHEQRKSIDCPKDDNDDDDDDDGSNNNNMRKEKETKKKVSAQDSVCMMESNELNTCCPCQ
jgi:hypothetical protein